MRKFVFILFVSLVLAGCKTVAPCIPETTIRDSIRVQQVLDSVYLYERDSIYVNAKAETVFIDHWKIRYKDVIKIQHDTIIDTRHETQVQEVRYVPKFYKVCTWIGCICVALLVLWIAIKFLK